MTKPAITLFTLPKMNDPNRVRPAVPKSLKTAIAAWQHVQFSSRLTSFLFCVWCPVSWSSGFRPEREETETKTKEGGGTTESRGRRWFKAPCIFSIWRTLLVTESMVHWAMKEPICSPPEDGLWNQLATTLQRREGSGGGVYLSNSFNLVSFIFVFEKINVCGGNADLLWMQPITPRGHLDLSTWLKQILQRWWVELETNKQRQHESHHSLFFSIGNPINTMVYTEISCNFCVF